MIKHTHAYERQANYYETDQMSIIHHSNYIRWFEEARIDWLKQIGCSYRMMEEKGILIPVLAVSCEYKSPVRFYDIVEVIPAVTYFNGVKMNISYEILDKETRQLRVVGESKHGYVSSEFKPISLKRSFPEIYETILSYVQPKK